MKLNYVRLGNTGLKVSRLCIGCMSYGGGYGGRLEWTLGYEDSKKIIDKALDHGINFFDTADVYSNGKSEQIVGKALEGRRNDVVVATKVFSPTGEGPNEGGLGRKHVRQNLKRSLGNLRTDYVDLYQIHRWDYETPIAEVLDTLTQLVRRDGTVNYIGASSMWAWQFAKALYTSDRLGLERFVSMQDLYNLAYREEEREMIPLCREEGIALIPWSPLGRGFLSGKYKRGEKPGGSRYEKDPFMRATYFRDKDFDVLERLEEVAKEKGITPTQLALAWVLSKPEVTSPIVGPTKVSQLDELVAALNVTLTADEKKRLEEPYVPRPIQGHE
jgi:aryl-alcohol dehydrogenase (NADP+)